MLNNERKRLQPNRIVVNYKVSWKVNDEDKGVRKEDNNKKKKEEEEIDLKRRVRPERKKERTGKSVKQVVKVKKKKKKKKRKEATVE